MCGQCVISVQSVYGKRMVSVHIVLAVYGQCVVSLWSVCGQCVHLLLQGDVPMRRQHSTGITDSYETRNR